MMGLIIKNLGEGSATSLVRDQNNSKLERYIMSYDHAIYGLDGPSSLAIKMVLTH